MARTGIGYDVHQLVEGESLIIGGVEIPSKFGSEGHSDGDGLIHAVVDALLGAAASVSYTHLTLPTICSV